MKRILLLFLFAMLIDTDAELSAASFSRPPLNVDETKVPPFVLPNPLLTKDGRKVDSPKLWNEVRRPELLAAFTEEMYGNPPFPADLPSVGVSMRTEKIAEPDPAVFGGKGTRHQIRLRFFNGEQPKDGDPNIDVLIYTPNNAKKKVPAFLGLNFRGNHTIAADPGIVPGTIWARADGGRDAPADGPGPLAPLPAREEDRGSMAGRWPVEMILDRGFAVATAHYCDIEPDCVKGISHGVRKILDRKAEDLKPNDAGTIATWAWGLSRIRELVLSAENLNIDPAKIAVIGHSRLGKTALWAGATDPKFALAVSNNSGCGGAALSRRIYGETLLLLNGVRPHWYCGNFKKYNEAENTLPFDQHELLALIAPRPVYIASAEEDKGADPTGEFLAAFHADPVYILLGKSGFYGVTVMPHAGPSVGGTIGYHLRPGKHDITAFDWKHFLDFAERHFPKN